MKAVCNNGYWRSFKIRAELKKLLGAIAHENYEEAMKAHKALYNIGSPAIPLISDTLFGLDWSHTTSSRVKAAVEMRYITGLVSLIHDIDETEAQKVAQQLIQKGCSATARQRLKSILEFTLDDYLQYKIRGVNIFEHKGINSRFNIQSKLERWFGNVSDDDLREIDRIYIVSRTEAQDYAGCYTPIFYNIKLVWDMPSAKFNPVTWLKLLWIEIVFYHEIGHHVRRYGFGQLEEQEDEANSYALQIFLSSRPALYKTLGVIFKVVRLFRRKSTVIASNIK
jgi:hypothetical protein